MKIEQKGLDSSNEHSPTKVGGVITHPLDRVGEKSIDTIREQSTNSEVDEYSGNIKIKMDYAWKLKHLEQRQTTETTTKLAYVRPRYIY